MQAPTIKAERGTVASKACSTTKRGLGPPVPLTGGSVPLMGPSVPLIPYGGDPFPLRTSSNCLIVGRGPGSEIARVPGYP